MPPRKQSQEWPGCGPESSAVLASAPRPRRHPRTQPPIRAEQVSPEHRLQEHRLPVQQRRRLQALRHSAPSPAQRDQITAARAPPSCTGYQPAAASNCRIQRDRHAGRRRCSIGLCTRNCTPVTTARHVASTFKATRVARGPAGAFQLKPKLNK